MAEAAVRLPPMVEAEAAEVVLLPLLEAAVEVLPLPQVAAEVVRLPFLRSGGERQTP